MTGRVSAKLLAICFALYFTYSGNAQAPGSANPGSAKKDKPMTATGPFDVKLSALPLDNKAADPSLARMSIDKQFHGDLEAASKGEMLSAGSPVKGSAGYVAIEHVSGSLKGRTGTFILQHSATMNRGTPNLSIIVVPDSGTGQLTGLAGKMSIQIATGGKHSYEFEYTLPEAP